jgi:hypothetical protein
MSPFKIAVEGCVSLFLSHGSEFALTAKAHGALNHIYSTLEEKCNDRGWVLADIDLLILCGDFKVCHTLGVTRTALNQLVGRTQRTRSKLHVGPETLPPAG